MRSFEMNTLAAPTREELIAALDRLLETPRAESDCDYPKMSAERVRELDDFFRLVRLAVAKPDLDGAHVLTWQIINHAERYNPVPIGTLPLEFDTFEKLSEAVRTLGSINRYAGMLQERITGDMNVWHRPNP
jgi:hypothetical protein